MAAYCNVGFVSPKTDWLRRIGITGEWPMTGLPKAMHLDGAAEFKRKALLRGRKSAAFVKVQIGHRSPHAKNSNAL